MWGCQTKGRAEQQIKFYPEQVYNIVIAASIEARVILIEAVKNDEKMYGV